MNSLRMKDTDRLFFTLAANFISQFFICFFTLSFFFLNHWDILSVYVVKSGLEKTPRKTAEG